MKLNQLTSTRFIAAILIVFYHFGRETYTHFYEPIQLLINKANLGVSYFFILSGFVMILAYSEKNIDFKQYYLNRLARIYPSYLLALSLVVGYLLARHSTVDITAFILGVLGIQAWFPQYATSLNFTGWSLAVELFFYALFPFLLKHVYQRYALNKVLFAIAIIWIMSQAYFHYLLFYPSSILSSNFIYFFPVMHLSSFLLGNGTGLLYLTIKRQEVSSHRFIILGLVLLLYYILDTPISLDFHNGLLALIYVPILLFISLEPKPFRLLNSKILVFLGEISYGIYIYQYPIYLFTPAILRRLGLEMSFGGYLLILLTFCTLNYWFIETRLRKLLLQ